MIYGDFLDWSRDRLGISPRLVAILEWLKTANWDTWDQGAYPLPIEGEDGTLIIKECALQPEAEVHFEHHELHIDIHYCISGMESIGFTRDNGLNQEILADPPVEDHSFYAAVNDAHRLVLNPGMYAVFFPGDLHQPCCRAPSASKARKALVKLPI